MTVKLTGCGFDRHSKKLNIYLHLYSHVFATQHAMPPDLGGKGGTECLSTRFPSDYLAVCGIQREADFLILYVTVCFCACGSRIDGYGTWVVDRKEY